MIRDPCSALSREIILRAAQGIASEVKEVVEDADRGNAEHRGEEACDFFFARVARRREAPAELFAEARRELAPHNLAQRILRKRLHEENLTRDLVRRELSEREVAQCLRGGRRSRPRDDRRIDVLAERCVRDGEVAASTTSGCRRRAASTSNGDTLNPPRLMSSFTRPVR